MTRPEIRKQVELVSSKLDDVRKEAWVLIAALIEDHAAVADIYDAFANNERDKLVEEMTETLDLVGALCKVIKPDLEEDDGRVFGYQPLTSAIQ